MSFINNIISWFKSTFGITPEKKSERESDSDFDIVDDLSITATLAERITVLATVDSTVEVVGDNMRANYLNKYMQWIVNTKLAAISEICLGTGDCLARPNTNGNRIGIDIIQNKDFIIVESIGDFLLSVLINSKNGTSRMPSFSPTSADEELSTSMALSRTSFFPLLHPQMYI